MKSNSRNMHFVGIGGIGMSGLARVMIEMGHRVTGSDVTMNGLTKKLEAMGAEIFEGHRAQNVSEDTDLLVYSSSVTKGNPELKEARRRKVKIVHRAEVLKDILNNKKGIAITGTHGKTTTTSMISVILARNGYDPTVVIGGEVDEFEGNSRLGKGEYAVAEADESDSSFLRLKPLYGVITNIEMEHMDHFKDLLHIKRSYKSFADKINKKGMMFYGCQDEHCREIAAGFKGRSMSFGLSKDADIYPGDIQTDRFKSSFRCVYNNTVLGRVELSVPGKHNVANALAAILTCLNLGLKFKDIAAALKSFRGAKRRFQLRSKKAGIMLIDDYAHHPTEIRAVIDACRSWNGKRLIAIFQPHRYSRTKFLAEEFSRCFDGVDVLILTDIYPASEKPIRGVSIKSISEKIKSKKTLKVVVLDKEKIASYVMQIKKRNDMIVVMGAGDIKKVSDELADRLENETGVRNQISEKLSNIIKGKVVCGQSLNTRTTFRIGGPADIWFEPKDNADLKRSLIFARKNKVPVFIIGNGSNVLASDEGFRGMVIRLTSAGFKHIDIKGTNVCVGSGFALPALVKLCCQKGLRGLESLVGIPGTVGGAIFMNAGGWTSPMYKNIGDMVTSLKVMDYNGNIMNIDRKNISFGYRQSCLGNYVILEARFKLKKANKEDLISNLTRFMKMKRQKQVLNIPSAGCVFKNPENFQFTCGQMIDMLGLKGKRVGQAEVSTKHANFIVNRGRSSCNDVLNLVEYVRNKVKENYGIGLDLEVKVL